MSPGARILGGLAGLAALAGVGYGIHGVAGHATEEVRAESRAASPGGIRGRTAPKVEKSWSFDEDQTGRISAGWTNETGTWQVVADADAPSKPNCLAQVSSNHSGGYFNVAVANAPEVKDLELSVK